ncbi:UNVERIFIED_CONTAM: hypothetical protein GTU68_038274 [Idotea baltica]|nr:hypothetical protein [Idotea baltica]
MMPIVRGLLYTSCLVEKPEL